MHVEQFEAGDIVARVGAGEGLLGVALDAVGPIEIVDPGAWLGDMGQRAPGRVCVLAGEGHNWMASFLAPVLEDAGYRVLAKPPADGAVTAFLAMEGDDAVPDTGPVVRLSERPGGDAVYRYDRAGVLAALEKVAR